MANGIDKRLSELEEEINRLQLEVAYLSQKIEERIAPFKEIERAIANFVHDVEFAAGGEK